MAIDPRSLMPGRRCQGCGGVLPTRTWRQRDSAGRLVCPSCAGTNQPTWAALESEEVAQVRQPTAENRRAVLAHESDEDALIRHCPWCASGQVIGTSDGSVECGYCHRAFTVRIQPAYPAAPMTDPATGLPMPGHDPSLDAPQPPGVPGGGPPDPAVPPGTATDPAVDPAAPAPPSAGPPDTLRTRDGAGLPVASYLRHLALTHGADPAGVLAAIAVEDGL